MSSTDPQAPAADTASPAPTLTGVQIGQLGPFHVGMDGVLTPSDPAKAPGFGFRWRGRRIGAQFQASGRVVLSVIAGYVPFTAEAASDRPRALTAVAALRERLDADWRVRLTPDHAVHLEATSPLGTPLTATHLVATATRFVLQLEPCLDLLEESGARAG